MFNQWKEALGSKDLQVIINSTVGQMILWAVVIGVLIGLAAMSGGKKNRQFQVKTMAYSAMAITIATVLSYVKLLPLPQGGSVTLFSMLFIVLIGYWYGVRQGVLSGIVFGLLQLILQGYAVNPIQIILDYPLAFGLLGLSGLFKNGESGLLKGLLLGAFARFICHFVSGVVFFAAYTPEGFSPVAYSAAYNIAYIGIEVFLTAIVLMIPAMDKAMKTIKKAAISA